jgi:DNA primase
LFWEEVHMALEPEELTMFTVPIRASERGDPMAGLLTATPDVSSAVAKLERLLK